MKKAYPASSGLTLSRGLNRTASPAVLGARHGSRARIPLEVIAGTVPDDVHGQLVVRALSG